MNRPEWVKPNDCHFAFALTPVEAEMLYRELNARLNDMASDDPNYEALFKFRDRVLVFTRFHPCKYGEEAL